MDANTAEQAWAHQMELEHQESLENAQKALKTDDLAYKQWNDSLTPEKEK